MTTSGSHAQVVFARDKNVMDGRSGFRLRADWEIEVVESGACRRKPSVAADEFLKWW